MIKYYAWTHTWLESHFLFDSSKSLFSPFQYAVFQSLFLNFWNASCQMLIWWEIAFSVFLIALLCVIFCDKWNLKNTENKKGKRSFIVEFSFPSNIFLVCTLLLHGCNPSLYSIWSSFFLTVRLLTLKIFNTLIIEVILMVT